VNPLTYWDLAVGVGLFFAYVVWALCKRTKPDLPTGINIFAATAGVAGAVRLVGYSFTEAYKKLSETPLSNGMWSMSSDDIAFLVVGGLALGWVSCQQIWLAFADL
jgi:hypothetical protein